MENFDQKNKAYKYSGRQKKSLASKVLRGLKLFCYPAGEKNFKFKYQLESGNYTTF